MPDPKDVDAVRDRMTAEFTQTARASLDHDELSPCSALNGLRGPLAESLGKAFKRGFNAATYDHPALRVLSSLRWRAHREKRPELALLIEALEYRIQNWDSSLPVRELPLPDCEIKFPKPQLPMA